MSDLSAPAVLKQIIQDEFNGVDRQLAEKAKIDRTIISRMLSRTRAFSTDHARSILRILPEPAQGDFAEALVVDYLGEEAISMILKKHEATV